MFNNLHQFINIGVGGAKYGDELLDTGEINDSSGVTITYIVNGISVVSDGTDTEAWLSSINWDELNSGNYRMILTQTTISGTANTQLVIGDSTIILEDGKKENIKFTHEQLDTIEINFDGTEVFEIVIDISLKGALSNEVPSPITETVLFAYDTGSQVDEFVTDVKIDSLIGIVNSINTPDRYVDNPIFRSKSSPAGTWDERKNYNTVIFIDGVYKMWYTAVTNETPIELCICYATSLDGYNWTKPIIGAIDFNGSTDNNILPIGTGYEYFDSSVVYDPSAPTDRKYILLTQEVGNPNNPLSLWKSTDGLAWVLIQTLARVPYEYLEPKELIKREDGKWLAYYFQNQPTDRREMCAFISDTTDPTGTWSDYGVVYPITGATDQTYRIGVEYFNDIYYGFVSIYNSITENIHTNLAVSTDGLVWTEIKQEWIALGDTDEWDDEMVMGGHSMLKFGDEWRHYYNGFPEDHAYSSAFGRYESMVGIAAIGYNRIGQYTGDGRLITTAFTPTDILKLNAKIKSSADLKIELLDASDDSVIVNYSKDDYDNLIGDLKNTEVTWGGASIPTDTNLKLKFYLGDQSNVVDPPEETGLLESLLSYYPLDVVEPGLKALDLHGGIDGDAVGITEEDSSYYFLNNNSYVDLGVYDNLFDDTTSKISISFWIKLGNISVNQMVIAKNYISDRSFYFNIFGGGDLRVYFGTDYNNGKYDYYTTSSTPVPIDTWCHVAMATDVASGVCTFWVDGIAHSTTRTPAQGGVSILGSSDEKLYWGGYANSSGTYTRLTDTNLKKGAIWNRVLLQEDVDYLYADTPFEDW